MTMSGASPGNWPKAADNAYWITMARHGEQGRKNLTSGGPNFGLTALAVRELFQLAAAARSQPFPAHLRKRLMHIKRTLR